MLPHFKTLIKTRSDPMFYVVHGESRTHCNTVDDEASCTVPMSLSTKGFKFNVLHNSTDIARKKLGSASSLPPHFHVCLVLFIFNLCSYNFSVSQFSYCL
ncbi:hypothetical protein MtrunA17_Chr4g0059581 [Medicago truncatula]|uniref:Uncharacterized protein n=1 Tax=Medicago truncatula TaxID=3880 RepID=A0A396IKU6_MEDTR|nr:hypothetical protein MtrunA17_Chr4g0059581 [Medicago truncatula]